MLSTTFDTFELLFGPKTTTTKTQQITLDYPVLSTVSPINPEYDQFHSAPDINKKCVLQLGAPEQATKSQSLLNSSTPHFNFAASLRSSA